MAIYGIDNGNYDDSYSESDNVDDFDYNDNL